jgi:hypothetical protein
MERSCNHPNFTASQIHRIGPHMQMIFWESVKTSDPHSGVLKFGIWMMSWESEIYRDCKPARHTIPKADAFHQKGEPDDRLFQWSGSSTSISTAELLSQSHNKASSPWLKSNGSRQMIFAFWNCKTRITSNHLQWFPCKALISAPEKNVTKNLVHMCVNLPGLVLVS